MTASTASTRALADTNIVVYAHDPGDPTKHQHAKELLAELSSAGRLVYSTQVLNEFCAVMMRPHRASPLSPDEVVEIIHDLSATGQVVTITAATTLLALNAMKPHSLSFWDALLWAAARENAVEVIYTEDFQHGRVVDGVRFLNPFNRGA
jgi:predicted nucleic acid-binding protein